MNKITNIFEENGISYSILSRKEGFSIHHEWLELFAWKVKQQTGKYTINGFAWEAYWAQLIYSLDSDSGISEYQSKEPEDFYVIFENGEIVFNCAGSVWPDLFSIEAIVFPKSKNGLWFSPTKTLRTM